MREKKVRKKLVCDEMMALADLRRLKERKLSQKKNQRESAKKISGNLREKESLKDILKGFCVNFVYNF